MSDKLKVNEPKFNFELVSPHNRLKRGDLIELTIEESKAKIFVNKLKPSDVIVITEKKTAKPTKAEIAAQDALVADVKAKLIADATVIAQAELDKEEADKAAKDAKALADKK